MVVVVVLVCTFFMMMGEFKKILSLNYRCVVFSENHFGARIFDLNLMFIV